MRARWPLCVLWIFFSTSASTAAEKPGAGPWPAPVPGWIPPRPGEHPRLLFRKGDLPELRRRAGTPEGRAILERLRKLLDGGDGETMTAVFSPATHAYMKGKYRNLVVETPGCYTISHAAGYGFLFLITGDGKYAEFGRQCFLEAFEGVRDRDDRYSWKAPGGALRAGPSLGWYALGYDLCYDGWDEAFRREVAGRIQGYDEGRFMSLAELARGKRHFPAVNHWGGQVGGGALALLAIRGDPGVDARKVEALLEANAKCMIRNMTEGWGDHGWFAEGDGPGCLSSDHAFVPALQAWRTAGGRDFITPRPNGPWMTLKWVMGTIGGGGKVSYPKRGEYGHNVWARNGMSGTGQFAQGFGAIADAYTPALLWLYDHVFKENDEKAGAPFDTIGPYPHRAILAFVNWPFGMRERNPGEVLPRAVMDRMGGHCFFRNRWKDGDDIVVTTLLEATRGYKKVGAGPILVHGLGARTTFPARMAGDPTFFEATASGGQVGVRGASLLVDFSGTCGSDGLIVMAAGERRGRVRTGSAAGGKIRTQAIRAGETTFVIMTLSATGRHPEAGAEGDGIVVGRRALAYDGEKILIAR